MTTKGIRTEWLNELVNTAWHRSAAAKSNSNQLSCTRIMIQAHGQSRSVPNQLVTAYSIDVPPVIDCMGTRIPSKTMKDDSRVRSVEPKMLRRCAPSGKKAGRLSQTVRDTERSSFTCLWPQNHEVRATETDSCTCPCREK